VDNTFQSLSTLSLCHGIGGLDHGLERGIAALRNPHGYQNQEGWDNRCAGILQYAAYVEIESIAAYNLVAKMEQGLLAPAPVFTDVKTFPYEQFYQKIHILTGGYPCQPFSQAGLQNGVADPRHLFPFIEHGIDAARPVLCFFENVANHLNIGYREVRARISSLGYKVEADIFAAEQVGAPHLRKRLFILAVAITSRTGEPMDNSFLPRLQRFGGNGSQRKRWEDTVRSIAETSFFPAGQGPTQYDWEEPRLESSMGFTINGYSFVEDLLRMAGNAVVQQQAELAFRTLIQKFL
jgi:DNA (cytosine-5)-methyltransferase 1